MPKAILLGSIGVLAETSDIQREAFNHAFAEARLKWFWGPDQYAELLQRSGGRARIEAFAAERGEHVDAEALHIRKSELFRERISKGVPLRAGVSEIMELATAQDIPVALCSTTSLENVRQILAATGLSETDFAFVGHRGVVDAEKPDPAIYVKALAELDLAASDCIAVEDSSVAASAARAASLPTVAFPGRYHQKDGFGALLVRTERLNASDLEIIMDRAA